MAVSALINSTTLVAASTDVTNSNVSMPTDVAFTLPDAKQNSATTTDDREQQPAAHAADNSVSDDSSETTDPITASLEVTPTHDSEQLASQQVTPLQLALGQTFSDNSTAAMAATQPALTTADASGIASGTTTDTSEISTDNTTLLPATNSHNRDLPLRRSNEKVTSTAEPNTTDTDSSNTTAANESSSQSLNISVLTLPAMPVTQANSASVAAAALSSNGLSTSTITPTTNASTMASTTSHIANDDNLNISSWLNTSTTAATLVSTTNNSAHVALTSKITNSADINTSQSLTQMLSEWSLFAESTPLASSATQNTSLTFTNTDTTSQQLGKQLLTTLKQQVSTQLSEKTQQATIRLDPPSLGQLNIAIRIDGDTMTVQINAEHSGVRDALQSSREQLRQLLSTEHNGAIDVNIGQQSSTPQQRQSAYALAADSDIISAATSPTSDTTTTAANSEPDTAGDWLNTVV